MIIAGKYEVTDKVGQGGMGIVYRVRHVDLDTILALKMLPRELSHDPQLVERFRLEARVMARLNHANIVRVFDFAQDGDTYYLVMEFLSGKNLRQVLQETMQRTKRPLPLSEVLRAGKQIADALAYAHGQTPAVVHRDIKPSNIIVEEKTARAVVTDFGIAKLMGESQIELTRTGLFVGTVKYCAPEQLRHDPDIDARADIYALGMMLYELYAGAHFFAELKDHEVIGRVLYEKRANEVHLPDAPPEFVRLVNRAIACDRSVRYSSTEDLIADLQVCLRLAEGEATDLDTTRKAGGAAAAIAEEDIDAQIRALELKRLQHLLAQARRDCQRARAAAEQQGARDEAAEAFARADAIAEEAEALDSAGEHHAACDRFRDAAAGFEHTCKEAERRRAEHAVEQARATMRELARRATEASAAKLAPVALKRAEELGRTAEEAAGRGDTARAVAEFGEAAEAYGEAIATLRRAESLRVIEAELPAVDDDRRRAEEAGAPALAAAAFAAAVQDQERLGQALAAGQLTAAEKLLPSVREAFAEAAARAHRARAVQNVAEARESTTRAREAARAAGADGTVTEFAQAAAREADGAPAEATGDWEGAERIYREAAVLYEQAQAQALARAAEERARRAVEEAVAAMEAAKARAEQASAPEEAPTLFARARELADKAARRARTNKHADAASEYRQATNQYLQAAQVAERRTQRRALERRLAEVVEARAGAEAVGGGANAHFTRGEEAEAEAARALSEDELTAGAQALESAYGSYVAARTEADLARHLAEVDRALGRASARQEEAREAGADSAAPDGYGEADRLHAEARTKRDSNDWEAAIRLATASEEHYAASLVSAVGVARAEAEAAQEAARRAGVEPKDLEEGEARFRAAHEQVGTGPPVAAAVAFREAACAYRNVTEQTSAAAREARQTAIVARRAAEEAEALSRAASEFESAAQIFARAEREVGQQQFGAGVGAFRESERLFAEARTAAERARLREASLDRRKRAEDAREAATQVGAPELAAEEFENAGREFADGERALAAGDFESAEAAFHSASGAFAAVRAASERLAAERQVAAARDRARVLLADRHPPDYGRLARWKIGRADRALANGARAFEGGNLAAARSAFERAARLLETIPAVAGTEGATWAATVIRPVTRVSRRGPWLAMGGVAVVAAIGVSVWFRTGTVEWPAGEGSVEPTPAVLAKAEGIERKPPGGAAARRPEDVGGDRKSAAVPVEAPATPGFEPTSLLPPRIQRVEPAEAVVRLASGKEASFHVDVADAADAIYEWQVGGRVLSDVDAPTVMIPVRDDPQKVRVVVKTAGGEDTHEWQLAALPRATVAVVLRAPRILASAPRGGEIEIPIGRTERFQVTAESAAGERLAYAWTMDGRPVGRDAPTFALTPGGADEGRHRIEVGVRTSAGQAMSHGWMVSVPVAPVSIVRQSPGQDVILTLGSEAALSVEAGVGTRRDVPFSYTWSVDGKRVASASGPRFAYRVELPSADVKVVVDAPDRQAAVGLWRIRARAEPAPEAPSGRVAEHEIEAWIESYRTAYEQKDVEGLIALGVLAPGNRDKMRDVFNNLDDLRVRISARSIDVKGADLATVSLTRVDSFSGTEKAIPVKKTLRKRNGSWVAQ